MNIRTQFTILICCIFFTGVWASPARPDGALLTVIGKVQNSNRGGLDPFTDAFLNFNEYEFEKAYAFNRATLDSLPQHKVTAKAEGWPKAIEAFGPFLKDVLDAAGVARDAAVKVVALDGYTVEFKAEELSGREWLLATSVNGKLLDIGGRGPAWLLYDTAGQTASSDEEAKWVWSVYLLVAE